MKKLTALFATLALSGCPVEEPMGTVNGSVRVFQGAQSSRGSPMNAALKQQVLSKVRVTADPHGSGAAAAAAKLVVAKPARPRLLVGGTVHGQHMPQVIRPGEVIVRFHEQLSAEEAVRRLRVQGLELTHGGFASEYLHLAKFRAARGRELSEGETRELVAKLAARPGVKFTEPNGVRHALVVPNDNLYPAMWHLPPINMPAAWDIERGLTNAVTVAVIDTGVFNHPDLSSRLLPGFDMVSDTAMALDGDGRDGDATDPGGDLPNGRSSWHGTHCAGTIGAHTDNGSGIAGVNWNARLVPVRVLGKGGGTDFDISAGMNWASGGTVPGVAANANPAPVVSMSLGGQGGPLQSYQDIIDAAAGRNSIFVIAAGNDNIDASSFTPCNQTGVLCIGATRFNGKRASYSNFGQRIDLMAPGGEVAEDSNGDGYPDGVLSTAKDDSDGTAAYAFENGTSMACPHVAGIVSLMKAKVPTLTFTQARNALVQTANTSSQCSEGCGAGLVDVVAALRQVSGTMATGPARLSLGAAELFFTPAQTQGQLQVSNTGGMPLDVTLAVGGAEAGRITLGATSFTLAPGATRTVTVDANLGGLTAGTSTSALLRVSSNGGDASVNLKLRVHSAATRPAVIALVYQDTAGEWQIGGTVDAMPEAFTYSVKAVPGRYYVFGVQDANGNGMFEDNEPVGLYPNNDSPKELTLIESQVIDNITFALAPQTDLTDTQATIIGTPCTADAACAPGVCGTGFPGGYCTQDCARAACPLGARCVAGATVSVCLASCPGVRAGRSDCRAGYVCEDDGTGSGVCIPACAIDDDCAPSTCNTATGYCR